MSGIAGIFCALARAEEHRLARIHRALGHRGGKCEGFDVAGPVGLSYHQQVSDSSSLEEQQPLCVQDCWIVADARLDNREELLRVLPGDRQAASDAGLIARAYAQWGDECLHRLEGDFAFALWDSSRQSLFCARDPLGIRPFFYRYEGCGFAWASEVKALVADPEYTPAPDEAMVAEFLLTWSHFPDPAATFYRGIRQLPPGHFLTLERHQLRVQRYWDIDPAEEARYRGSFLDNVEEFRARFEQAVAQRLEGSETIAVLVSGGLDSTSISSVAERIASRNGNFRSPLYHLSYYAFAPHADERAYMDYFREEYGCRVDYLPIKGFRVLNEVEQCVDLVESPLLDMTWSLTQQWATYVRRRDLRVVLTGFGGDNIFPGGDHTYCVDIWRRHGWRAGWEALRRTAAYYDLSSWAFLRPTLRLLLPESLRRRAKRWLRKEIPAWIKRDFARRSGLLERVGEPLPRRGFSTLSQELDYLHLRSGRLALQLAYYDRMAAAHGLELRHPFFHPALVRFTVLVPPEHKVRNGETKLLLRQAMQGILPEVVRQRRDKGAPDRFLINWLRRHEAESWRRLAQTTYMSDDYVKRRQVRAVVGRLLAGDDRALIPAWTLLSLELWLRRNFGAKTN